jgi:hypothetical protein
LATRQLKEKLNQSTFDGVENIFNKYAGNCSQLDEFEVD